MGRKCNIQNIHQSAQWIVAQCSVKCSTCTVEYTECTVECGTVLSGEKWSAAISKPVQLLSKLPDCRREQQPMYCVGGTQVGAGGTQVHQLELLLLLSVVFVIYYRIWQMQLNFFWHFKHKYM